MSAPALTTHTTAIARPQVFFDDACPICRRETAHVRKRDKLGRADWIDIAAPGFDAAAYGLDPVRVHEVMHARGTDGTVYQGLDAVIFFMRVLPKTFITGPLLLLLKIPGMMIPARAYYRWFARNRYRLAGRCTPESCELPPPKMTADKHG